MIKRLILTASLLLIFVLMPAATSAIDIGRGLAGAAAGEAGYSPGTGETTLAQTLGTVAKAVLSFAGVVFLSLMVYAGYLWMTARGEEAQIEKAQKMIRGAIIGLIITVGAYSITAFVVPKVLERTTGTSGGQGRVGPPQQQPASGQCTWVFDNDTTGQTTQRVIDESFCRNECQRAANIANKTIKRCSFNGRQI